MKPKKGCGFVWVDSNGVSHTCTGDEKDHEGKRYTHDFGATESRPHEHVLGEVRR
jgi:hypothetical protein